MSAFAVVRHPDVAAPGIVPAAALALQRAKGWVRVSDLRDEPSDFNLDDFADVHDDLDAEPKAKATTTKESKA